ncbi:hypothetical protein HII31_08569, partial [Pseudocercospora fuligena]
LINPYSGASDFFNTSLARHSRNGLRPSAAERRLSCISRPFIRFHRLRYAYRYRAQARLSCFRIKIQTWCRAALLSRARHATKSIVSRRHKCYIGMSPCAIHPVSTSTAFGLLRGSVDELVFSWLVAFHFISNGSEAHQWE